MPVKMKQTYHFHNLFCHQYWHFKMYYVFLMSRTTWWDRKVQAPYNHYLKQKGKSIDSFPYSVIWTPSNWFWFVSIYCISWYYVIAFRRRQEEPLSWAPCFRGSTLFLFQPCMPLPTGKRGVPLLAHAPGTWHLWTVPSLHPGPTCSSWSWPWEGWLHYWGMCSQA